MSFNINFFGHIPYNPEIFPEQKKAYGQFTQRPVGLTLSQMCELYWTVRSFNISIGAQSINTISELDQFLMGGGASATIAGSLAGLASVNQSMNQGATGRVNGNTKILEVTTEKNRKQPSAVIDGKLQTDFTLSKELPNVFKSRNPEVSEGTICAAGPIHTISDPSGGSVTIDFSDIFFNKRLYWPRILISINSQSASLSSDGSSMAANVNVLGGITFANYGIISLVGASSIVPAPIIQVEGKISIGTRCSDRFYWDGSDRKKVCGEKEYKTTVSSLTINQGSSSAPSRWPGRGPHGRSWG